MMSTAELKDFILNPPTMPKEKQKECWCVHRSHLSHNNKDRIVTCLVCGGEVKDWYPKKDSNGAIIWKDWR